MFTGLIEATGRISSVERLGENARLTVEIPFADSLSVGESIAINGCCLTASGHDELTVSFDILAQTLSVTSLGNLLGGEIVNLERALPADGRLGGHFVQGHVDDTGEIVDLSPHGNDHRYEVALPAEVMRYCIPRGSLAVDGISLTIAELRDNSALFWITPHTFSATNLQSASEGQRVNLEADILAKHVENLIHRKDPP